MNEKSKKRKRQSNIDFRFMSALFKIRDRFNPPVNKIEKTSIKQGDSVLDYGCGSGSYTIAAAEVIGPSGKIYAADIHPLAIKKVKKKVFKQNLKNIKTILTDCNTGLTDNSMDSIICFDVIHGVENFQDILNEFYRILKPNGHLSIDDHHLSEDEIISKITSKGSFNLVEKKEKIYNFIKTKK